jgi:hypothetical protein
MGCLPISTMATSYGSALTPAGTSEILEAASRYVTTPAACGPPSRWTDTSGLSGSGCNITECYSPSAKPTSSVGAGAGFGLSGLFMQVRDLTGRRDTRFRHLMQLLRALCSSTAKQVLARG